MCFQWKFPPQRYCLCWPRQNIFQMTFSWNMVAEGKEEWMLPKTGQSWWELWAQLKHGQFVRVDGCFLIIKAWQHLAIKYWAHVLMPLFFLFFFGVRVRFYTRFYNSLLKFTAGFMKSMQKNLLYTLTVITLKLLQLVGYSSKSSKFQQDRWCFTHSSSACHWCGSCTGLYQYCEHAGIHFLWPPLERTLCEDTGTHQ